MRPRLMMALLITGVLSNAAPLESDATPPENLPEYGQKAATADVRSAVLTGRPVSVRQCVVVQPLTLITPWHLPCSSDRVVRKLKILSFESIACAKNKR